jgi:crotonobetainyl-CoA:carnitine CoA-transferase CaiB-like acyl-CoA transferase
MTRPLEGLRVLDFTHVLAGPFGTRVLGDLGADVIKVSSASRSVLANAEDHPYFVMWNRNKRALALDMTNEDAQDICRRLCEKADVVVENFSVGVMERWGCGYEKIRLANPGVIYISMPGMGRDGPWSSFVTYAPTVHALSGLTYMTGVEGRADIGIGFSYNDHQCGLHSVVSALSAIECRRRTGRGQYVDLSQFEVGVNFAGPSLLDYFANGRAAEPTANRLPYDNAAPHNCYRCAGEDRWVAIAVMTDEQWEAFRRVMGDPPWAPEDRFRSAAGRVANLEELDLHVAEWTRSLTPERVQALCQEAGVPAGVVQTGVDLAEHDPQLRESGFLTPADTPHSLYGEISVDRLPLHFSRTPANYYAAPRLVGEDNAAVLNDWLGVSEDEVRDGEERGVFR